MDESVLAALQRWPDVPAVYGWLSLDARGTWRLHPAGDGQQGGTGESITSPQILAFIARNYDSDTHGNWFFQNGPQRVYVRLDAAPFVLRLAGDGDGFETHTGLPVKAIRQWLLDDEGRLFALTEHGAAVVDSRDLGQVMDKLQDSTGRALLDILEQAGPVPAVQARDGSLAPAPFAYVATPSLAAHAGFIHNPTLARQD